MRGLAIFLGGFLTGAFLTALYTPERGEDLRYRIKALLKKRGLLPADNVDDFVEIIAREIEED